jgi:hypothetical protein
MKEKISGIVLSIICLNLSFGQELQDGQKRWNSVAPWSPGASKTMIANMPALDNSCTLNCLWSGEISFSQAGQTQCTVT